MTPFPPRACARGICRGSQGPHIARGLCEDHPACRCLQHAAHNYLDRLSDERFEALGEALREGETEKAFEMAHALKVVVGNLALTPVYQPISELTELLRYKKEGDYHGLYSKMMEERERLLSM